MTSPDRKARADKGAEAPGLSTLRNGNVRVAGHRTSVRLEPAMWQALRRVAMREHITLDALVTTIDGMRAESSLTSAIRVFLLEYFISAATDEGHARAGHGATARAVKRDD